MRADGSLGPDGTRVLVEAVSAARRAADEEGVEDLVAFATSAVRDATDSAEVLAAVREQTNVDLQVLVGEDEARLTFLAVRRWFGWSAGRLLCLDIGGGSLELSGGMDEVPDVAISLPLGAGRLTRDRLREDPPSAETIECVREQVRSELRTGAASVLQVARPDLAVATSKTFRSLARLGGAAPYALGPRVPRRLSLVGLEKTLDRVGSMTAAERTTLAGVSPSRAHQLLAGAIVAYETMVFLGLEHLSVCPWALREGVVLRRLDWLAGS